MSKFERKCNIGGLVITRKIGEVVVINKGEIRIEVVDISGGFVRLAFKAHKEIEIHRGESVVNPALEED